MNSTNQPLLGNQTPTRRVLPYLIFAVIAINTDIAQIFVGSLTDKLSGGETYYILPEEVKTYGNIAIVLAFIIIVLWSIRSKK